MKNFKIKEILQDRKFKNGSYSTGITIIVIAIIIVINLLVNELPSKYTKIDISDEKLFTISEQTQKIVSDLTEDVTLYLIAQDGLEDTTITELLDRYEDLSSHIKVVYKDPVLYPAFTTKYTSGDVNENSIIIESSKRAKVIDYTSLYETTFNYETYSTEVTGFDGEGQITSGINYTVSDNLPKVYILEGHNEASISDNLSAAISKENIDTESLSLLTQEMVPEDCDCLFLFSPMADISEEETVKIKEYLSGGGNAFIVSNYLEEETPNFNSILTDYGVSTADGIVFEGDSNYYYPGYNYYLIPEINSHIITAPIISANMNILMPVAQGITQSEDKRDTIEIESLLTTTASSYSKKMDGDTTTMEKEDGDTEGPFDIAVAITDTNDEIETKIVYLTGESMFADELNEQVAGANQDFILNSFGWMCEQESSITIHAKNLSSESLVVTEGDANFWSLVTIIAIPAGVLAVGIVIWIRRRKK